MMMKFGKSVLACVLANLIGWAFGLPTMWLAEASLRNGFGSLPPTILPSSSLPGLALGTVIFTLFSIIPSAVLGIPIQALLQKIRLTDPITNVVAAILFGYPVGILWMTFLMADQGEFNWHHIEAQFAYGLSPQTFSLFGGYLLFGSVAFWLIRRPDRDKLAAQTGSTIPA